jgi:hypothetical protein
MSHTASDFDALRQQILQRRRDRRGSYKGELAYHAARELEQRDPFTADVVRARRATKDAKKQFEYDQQQAIRKSQLEEPTLMLDKINEMPRAAAIVWQSIKGLVKAAPDAEDSSTDEELLEMKKDLLFRKKVLKTVLDEVSKQVEKIDLRLSRDQQA